MNFSNNAISAILLCSYIGINKDDALKPLSLGEWNEFLDKLIEMKLEPSIILSNDTTELKKMSYSDDFIDRITALAARGAGVAIELDALALKGIYVITLFDSDYPVLLKRKLKRKTPPVLFYAGDIQLAKKIGIAIVGSRNVDEDGIEFTKKIVEKATKEKLIIYSGGAKGVDTISEVTAINAGGAVVSFIADSLTSKIKKKEVINSIIQGKLLLLSDVKPETGFSAARAMNRNKYIYASSYGTFVVCSDYNKGGTWSGATEAIRNEWSKVLAWDNKNYSGNQKLIEKGAVPYEITDDKILDVVTKKEVTYDQLDLFNMSNVALVCEESAEYRVNENVGKND